MFEKKVFSYFVINTLFKTTIWQSIGFFMCFLFFCSFFLIKRLFIEKSCLYLWCSVGDYIKKNYFKSFD